MSSGHRQCTRRRSSDGSSSPGRSSSTTSTRASTTDTEARGGHRCSKRPSAPESHPSWVILNKFGARRDDFDGDRTTSTISRTSDGTEFSVSFELVEPPGTSVLILDYPPPAQGDDAAPVASTRRLRLRTEVIAAHRDVVLLQLISPDRDWNSPCDYFLYQASSGSSRRRRRRPSLSLLPAGYCEGETDHVGRPWQIILTQNVAGIMPCGGAGDSSSFVVAKLGTERVHPDSDHQTDIAVYLYMFRSGSGEWESFKDLHVRGANGGRDLHGWWAEAVMTYRRRFIIWVDYHRGMVLLDMSSSPPEKKNPNRPPPPPKLRYVPLPVDTVSGGPENGYYHDDRGCPAHSRSVCATRDGIKFVTVDQQHCSNFGVGNWRMLQWKHTFRITTWSLREDDDYTWRKDATMYEDQLWAVLDSDRRRRVFPHLTPEFPVVDAENPDAVCFRLNTKFYSSDEPTWMVQVDMKRKVLLAATAYANERRPYVNDEGTVKEARRCSHQSVSFPCELPRYLDLDGDGLACCKKRRQ